MNREGGERRLNVAITRARREVQVFSTLRADQIDLARTRARGVRDLKNFLEYAERGPSAIAEAIQYDPDADFDSPFEKAVYDVLVNKGWEVHQQVGCARYRIDLAVVNPKASGSYLLGIECDGANYHRAKTARDRDKLREGVLRELGWELHRVWSTDWWTNPEQEIRKLEAALEAAQSIRRQRRTDLKVRPSIGPTGKIKAAPIPESSAKRHKQESLVPEAPLHPTYSPYPVGRILGNPKDFYETTSIILIRRLITNVVEKEGPISLGLGARRVAAHWGIKKISKKALGWVRSLLLPETISLSSSTEGIFLWPKTLNPDTYEIFRIPGDDPESIRDSEDLPVCEVANAALFLLRLHIGAPEDEIVREAGHLFGFRKTGTHVRERMLSGVAFLVKKGLARREGTKIILEER